MTAKFDQSFRHSYECELLTEFDNRKLKTFYYPEVCENSGHDGVMIKVSPREQNTWRGLFAFARGEAASVSGVFSTPNENQICVVARGNGFFVDAESPTLWTELDQLVTDVRPCPHHEIIIFAGLTDITAYDEKGLRWTTDRISFDGLRIVGIGQNTLWGEYWDIRTENIGKFEVDLKTGSHGTVEF